MKQHLLVVLLLILTACSGGPPAQEIPQTGTTAQPAATRAVGVTPPRPAASAGPSQTAEPLTTAEPAVPAVCSPTQPDMLGPFYTPGAPVRTAVGQGYLLSGVVRSAVDCRPLPGAQIEFWMAGPDGVYTDDYRATLQTSADGSYRFESPFPPPYSGRPPHIHLRVSAPGYEALVTQHYPTAGQSSAVFDLVISP